jgi:thiol:disulfide interchange protein DsbC
MKRISLAFTLATLITSSVYADNLKNVKKEIENLEVFRNFNTKILDIKKVEKSWYALKLVQQTQVGPKTINAFTNKKLLFFGNGYDIEKNKILNIQTNFEQIKKDANFTIGNGEKEYFLVTDLECPYCKQLEELMPLLKDKAKVYVYLNPNILQSHLASKGMTKYILSFPKEERYKVARSLFLENDKSKILKMIDIYNISMYETILKYQSNTNADRLLKPYIYALEKAFNVKLDNSKKLTNFLMQKISNCKANINKKVEELFEKTNEINSAYLNTNGTPTVFDINGKKLENQFQMFYQNNIVNIKKIKEIAHNPEFEITAGEGKKDLYYFIGTQCGYCKQAFNNKKDFNKMLKEYKVHFILTLNGSNYAKAQKEIMYIYSQKDKNMRYKLLKAIMEGKELSPQELNKTYSKEYSYKISAFVNRDVRMTFVNGTPSKVDENGRIID